jgi:hypothetical protein
VDETSGRSFEEMKATSFVHNHASCQNPQRNYSRSRQLGVTLVARRLWWTDGGYIQAALHYAKATEECH